MSTTTLENTIHDLLGLKPLREELNAETQSLEDAIKTTMGTEETLIAGAFKVTWPPYTFTRFDTIRFKQDHADLAAAYTNATTARRISLR